MSKFTGSEGVAKDADAEWMMCELMDVDLAKCVVLLRVCLAQEGSEECVDAAQVEDGVSLGR